MLFIGVRCGHHFFLIQIANSQAFAVSSCDLRVVDARIRGMGERGRGRCSAHRTPTPEPDTNPGTC